MQVSFVIKNDVERDIIFPWQLYRSQEVILQAKIAAGGTLVIGEVFVIGETELRVLNIRFPWTNLELDQKILR